MHHTLNGLRAPELQIDRKVTISVLRRRRIAGARLPELFKAVPALAFGFVLAGSVVQAHAVILSSCANTSVTEGQGGVVDCTVTNFGIDPVNILGEFAFSYSVGGDPSDKILSVRVIGPNPPMGNPLVYQVKFTTPNDGPEPNPDFGLNDVSLILRAEDAITHQFVPGLYLSAAVAVYDIGLAPVDPVTVGTPIFIFTEDDYSDTVDDAEGRGYVVSTPEPATLLMVGTGLAGLAGVLRRRRA